MKIWVRYLSEMYKYLYKYFDMIFDAPLMCQECIDASFLVRFCPYYIVPVLWISSFTGSNNTF